MTAETGRTQIRGSALLLGGKGISALLNFGTQVLIARQLTKGDYGAFIYALSAVAFFQVFCTLGMQVAIPRFVPIYDERRDYSKVFGAIAVAIGTVLLTSALIFAASSVVPSRWVNYVVRDRHAASLLFMVLPLVPLQALDTVLGGLFASLTNARTIFFRMHVLAPALKTAVALVFIAFNSRADFLAYGYVVATALGIMINVAVLRAILKRKNILQSFSVRRLELPAKEMFAFALPMLSSDLVTAGMVSTIAVFLLAHYHGAAEVAAYRVVVPAAFTNMTVITSFFTLYAPLAARLFARKDYSAINALYWTTTIWMAVLSFPVFLLTFSMAVPLTIFLYGQRYASSGIILAILSVGYFFNVCLGMNSETLRVFGVVRYILVVNVLSIICGTGLSLPLIQHYGALGAAIGTAGALIIRNLLTHAGLRWATSVRLFNPAYLPLYVAMTGGALAVFALPLFGPIGTAAAVVLAPFVAMAVFVAATRHLQIGETFPELLKISLVRFLLRISEQVNKRISAMPRRMAATTVRGSAHTEVGHEPAPAGPRTTQEPVV